MRSLFFTRSVVAGFLAKSTRSPPTKSTLAFEVLGPVGSISLSHLFISRLGLFVICLSTPSPAKDGTSAGVLRPPTKKLHRDIPKTRGLAKRNKKAAEDSVIFLGWAVWKRRSFYLVCFGADGFFEKTQVLMSCFISPHFFLDRCLDVVYFMIF